MKLSLSAQVLIAVILGIIAGLFLGPLTEVLKPIGSAYTMLLQMAALPYICFSLIHGLGSIAPAMGKKLFRSGWPYLLFVWVLIFGLISLVTLIIPDSIAPLIKMDQMEAFQSNFTNNFLTYLVPQNPFYDVVNNIVPAIAVFGLIVGIALMHIEKKEPLIGMLERIVQTIEKILYWLGLLSPIGAFVYISSAFGTIHFEDLYKIEIYVIAFIFTVLLITFWLLPTLIAHLTPLSFKEAVQSIRYVSLLAFVTGLATAALPFLNLYLKKLSTKHQLHEGFRETSQTVLPISYTFGNIGNAMTLFFVIFLGFYYRHPFSGTEKILLSLLTVPLSIGSSTSNLNSMSFLIKQLELPSSAMDFFLEIKSITYNFQMMMNIAGVITVIILTIYSYYGLVKIQWRPLFVKLGLTFACVALLVFSSRSTIHFKDNYLNLYMSHRIADVIPNPTTAKILTMENRGTPRTTPDHYFSETLKQILSSNTLKVGFNPESIPYCYYNEHNELVGYDIAYAYQLAQDLDCQLEFVPFHFDHLVQDIKDGYFDIGMSSIIMSEKRILEIDFTAPYREDNNVLIVPTKKKNLFLKLDAIKAIEGLKIGAGGVQVQTASRHFPKATIVDIFAQESLMKGEIDAIFWSESTAFVWCLTHPDFVAIEYGDQLGKSYFSYPIRQNSVDFRFFFNNWLTLKRQSGFKERMTSYWIEGDSMRKKTPRWSILRNVLHWTD